VRPIIALAMLGMLAFCAEGADYYVSDHGDDGAPGTSLDAPWRTIAKANASAAAGDTVFIRGGTYAEAIAPAADGTEAAPIMFKAYAGEAVTLTGVPIGISMVNRACVVVDGISCRQVGQYIVLDNSHHVQITNGTFDEWARKEGWVNGVVLRNDAHHNRISNCWIGRVGYSTANDDIGGTMYIGGGSNRNVVENCTLCYGGHHVLQIVSTHNVIRNNYFHNEEWMDAPHRTETGGKSGNRLAILEGGGAWNVLEGNVFAFSGLPPDQNGSAGISVRTAHNIVRRNVFYDNDLAGLNVSLNSRRQDVHFNYIYQNTFFRNAYAAKETFGPFLSGLSLTNYVRGSIAGVSIVNNLFWQNKGGVALSFYHCDRAEQSVRGNWEEQSPPLFVHTETPADPLKPGVLDFHLQPQSPCVDAGDFLTRTTAAGQGTTIPVAEAGFFTDGYGAVEGDLIQLEGQTHPLRILAIDYEANTLRVDSPAVWQAGQGVSQPFDGARPDIGAFER
jgi:hypothetical protein